MDDPRAILRRMDKQDAIMTSTKTKWREASQYSTILQRTSKLATSASGVHINAVNYLRGRGGSQSSAPPSLREVLREAEGETSNLGAILTPSSYLLLPIKQAVGVKRKSLSISARSNSPTVESRSRSPCPQCDPKKHRWLSQSYSRLLTPAADDDTNLNQQASKHGCWSLLSLTSSLQSSLADEVSLPDDAERDHVEHHSNDETLDTDDDDLREDEDAVTGDTPSWTSLKQRCRDMKFKKGWMRPAEDEKVEHTDDKTLGQEQGGVGIEQPTSFEDVFDRDIDEESLKLLLSVSKNLSGIHRNRQKRHKKLEEQRTVQLLTFVSIGLAANRRMEEAAESATSLS